MTFIFLSLTLTIVGASLAADKPPRFQDFTCKNVYKGKPATVDLSGNADARRFRTQLRTQAAEGANFAGHYRFAIWGCGTACAQFAIVDCKTGKVNFPANLSYVTWEGDDPGFKFRVDSRLLIVHDALLEESKRGNFYYLWETNRLRLIRSELKK